MHLHSCFGCIAVNLTITGCCFFFFWKYYYWLQVCWMGYLYHFLFCCCRLYDICIFGVLPWFWKVFHMICIFDISNYAPFIGIALHLVEIGWVGDVHGPECGEWSNAHICSISRCHVLVTDSQVWIWTQINQSKHLILIRWQIGEVYVYVGKSHIIYWIMHVTLCYSVNLPIWLWIKIYHIWNRKCMWTLRSLTHSLTLKTP